VIFGIARISFFPAVCTSVPCMGATAYFALA
jgi:hypothetical protein